MSRAKRLPFTELKIDRAFVMDVGESSSSRTALLSDVAPLLATGFSVQTEASNGAEQTLTA
ncbi:MAG: hypothetical protein C0463_05200 [Idiomarina sp.]|uniref:EAL domain-containing protein n=1 Tax=Aliidiomarina maris TaxID=531312 RepID=A0ABY0BQA9_9GAMM|nr:hypothetical protein [Idiomarina sp.]RUO22744.1 hypothetical protein CWE07_10795 [Aliidiomarina maris]